MPLATHPDAIYEVVLSTDKHLPKDKQPVFVFRYLSVMEWQEIAKLNDKFEGTTNADEMIDLAFQVIKKTLRSWRNMTTAKGRKIPYDPEKLKTMVTLQEATELMMAAVSQRPSLESKKKLESPSRSGSGKRAKNVKDRKRVRKSQRK